MSFHVNEQSETGANSSPASHFKSLRVVGVSRREPRARSNIPARSLARPPVSPNRLRPWPRCPAPLPPHLFFRGERGPHRAEPSRAGTPAAAVRWRSLSTGAAGETLTGCRCRCQVQSCLKQHCGAQRSRAERIVAGPAVRAACSLTCPYPKPRRVDLTPPHLSPGPGPQHTNPIRLCSAACSRLADTLHQDPAPGPCR